MDILLAPAAAHKSAGMMIASRFPRSRIMGRNPTCQGGVIGDKGFIDSFPTYGRAVDRLK
jgi:hypothetical protein